MTLHFRIAHKCFFPPGADDSLARAGIGDEKEKKEKKRKKKETRRSWLRTYIQWVEKVSPRVTRCVAASPALNREQSAKQLIG